MTSMSIVEVECETSKGPRPCQRSKPNIHKRRLQLLQTFLQLLVCHSHGLKLIYDRNNDARPMMEGGLSNSNANDENHKPCSSRKSRFLLSYWRSNSEYNATGTKRHWLSNMLESEPTKHSWPSRAHHLVWQELHASLQGG